jgi:galactokinase
VIDVVTRVRTRFAGVFGASHAPTVAFAPGRVNLIGEHTDYNDGFVLPMAIDRGVAVAFTRRPDSLIRAHSVHFGATREVSIDTASPPGGSDWTSYVGGVAWAMRAAGLETPGLDLVFDGDLPMGAGLSSSAALETAVARALCRAAGTEWDALAIARICRRAENEFVGVGCGIMDQIAAAAGREGCALLLDCRTLETTWVPVPEDAAVVVMDTGVRRSLAESAYNDRRAACEAVASALRAMDPSVHSLRDADPALLESARERLDPMAFRRALHVVEESGRPVAMAQALRTRDLVRAGRLMNESHASLRDLYQVSCTELDLVTRIARAHPACYGARMTGAGFGGCAVALVEASRADRVVEDVETAYRKESSRLGACFKVRPEAGARILA